MCRPSNRGYELARVAPLKIAHFSPLPPQRSGIATYCAALLPHLAEHAKVDVYVDEPNAVDLDLMLRFHPRSIVDFMMIRDQRYRYDLAVYHIGNHSAYHHQIYSACVNCPGIVVLHEVDLNALFWNWPAPDRSVYLREMGYAHGMTGTREARREIEEGRVSSSDAYPLFNRLADVSLGLIVHTPYARKCVLAAMPHARVAYIPEGVDMPQSTTNQRPALFNQLPPDAIVLGSFGYIAPSKRIDHVLRVVAQLRSESPGLRYVIVGEPIADYDLSGLIAQFGLNDVVHVLGFVDDAQFRATMEAIDIGINLRTGPTGGEMSATLLQLLASARPTIVSNVGGFTDLPDECVIKIDQDQHEFERLAEALRSLTANAALRAAYGTAAQRYARTEFSMARVAQQYVDFMRECQAAIIAALIDQAGA